MNEIKCLKNLKQLKELFLNGEKGDAAYFAAKLNVSERTFYRLLYYLKQVNDLKISFDKTRKLYYLDSL